MVPGVVNGVKMGREGDKVGPADDFESEPRPAEDGTALGNVGTWW